MLTKKNWESFFHFSFFLYFFILFISKQEIWDLTVLCRSPNAIPSTLQFQDARQAEDSFEEKSFWRKNSPGREGVWKAKEGQNLRQQTALQTLQLVFQESVWPLFHFAKNLEKSLSIFQRLTSGYLNVIRCLRFILATLKILKTDNKLFACTSNSSLSPWPCPFNEVVIVD